MADTPFVKWRKKISNQVFQIQSNDENLYVMRNQPQYLELCLAEL